MVAELPCSNYSRHFFKVMIDDFHTELSIPPRFSGKLNGDKMEKALLTSYRGSWDVEVGKCGRLCHFKKGWEEFVRSHDLNLGDFVVFEHKGNMRFDVLVLDSSACEKRLSNKSGNKRGRASGQADNICDHHAKHIKLESDSGVSQKRRPMPQGSNYSHDHVRQSKFEAAASPASERPYFTKTISSANRLRRFPYLNIPANFWRSNDILTEERTIALRDPLKRIWTVKLRFQRRDRRLSLGRGWLEFCEGNKLEIGDVCVFELNPTTPRSPCPRLDVWTIPPPK